MPAPDAAGPRRRPSGRPAILTEVRSTVRRRWIDTAAIAAAATAAARAEGFAAGVLSIAIVGRTSMARLHGLHSGDPTPTDVLTFDLGCDLRKGRIDGEIIVCADVAQTAAHRSPRSAVRPEGRHPSRRSPRHPALAELVLYVVHGVLHLAGHDDRTSAAFRRMHAREDEILTALGWGPLFSANGHPAAEARTRR